MHLLNKLRNHVHNGPMGNAKQILPALAVAGGIAGLVGTGVQAYGAWKNSQWEPSISPLGEADIRAQMGQSQAALGQMGGTVGQMQAGYGQMQGIGQEMMDPNSQINQDQYNRMKTQGAGQLALSTLLNRRQAAGSGLDSGIMAAQQRGQQSQLASSLRDQYSNQLMQNRMGGIGILQNSQSLLGQIGGLQGNIFTGQRGIDTDATQASIARNQWMMDEEQRGQDAKMGVYNAFGQGLQGIGSGMMNLSGQE